jgi:hypothetical protein
MRRLLIAFIGVSLLAAKPGIPKKQKLVLTNAQLRMLSSAYLDFTTRAYPLEMDYPESPTVLEDYGATIEQNDGGTLIRFAVDATYKGPFLVGGTVRYEFGADAGLLVRVLEK